MRQLCYIQFYYKIISSIFNLSINTEVYCGNGTEGQCPIQDFQPIQVRVNNSVAHYRYLLSLPVSVKNMLLVVQAADIANVNTPFLHIQIALVVEMAIVLVMKIVQIVLLTALLPVVLAIFC